ncbi:hypothetical protein POF50_009560 [Streptomyces sp. SL13]|uniref:Uncharacterized protein n=1 Tax=Streptantibioticus silvisoli TaxID=2705255 RepID=A0AA90K8L2_9ACTN|nr:hypothetical protein [Streptantibioticus silvisoli]MDI5967501.1 hypothetical protein [Streptantibioticus silvisoli]MDI5969582.1 hypothetical protein [Streptantibioticus silvisoli]
MNTHTVNPIRGSTAASALPPPRTAPPGAGPRPDLDPDHPRHRLGEMLRAAGVFLDTAFRVVVLGADGTRHSGPLGAGIPRQGRGEH